jgi:hypothetical protein
MRIGSLRSGTRSVWFLAVFVASIGAGATVAWFFK